MTAESVSIRAPAWGATFGMDRGADVGAVSIRAPAWGATIVRKLIERYIEVSIRAPAWGATMTANNRFSFAGVSIRAPAWGATSFPVAPAQEAPFQFALPRGERRIAGRQRAVWRSFNSRSRVGSDQTHLQQRGGGEVSIRAPAWGATDIYMRYVTTHLFQFALPRGERRILPTTHSMPLLFQFALPRGERP